jgi:hypothetical protein
MALGSLLLARRLLRAFLALVKEYRPCIFLAFFGGGLYAFFFDTADDDFLPPPPDV